MTTYTITSNGEGQPGIYRTWEKAVAVASRIPGRIVITEWDADGVREYDLNGNIISRDGDPNWRDDR